MTPNMETCQEIFCISMWNVLDLWVNFFGILEWKLWFICSFIGESHSWKSLRINGKRMLAIIPQPSNSLGLQKTAPQWFFWKYISGCSSVHRIGWKPGVNAAAAGIIHLEELIQRGNNMTDNKQKVWATLFSYARISFTFVKENAHDHNSWHLAIGRIQLKS